uniref:Uncharacterized protein n=1 Tax=Podarcis muralis TaxID=64176 RepID=A0A670JDY3_PODMU
LPGPTIIKDKEVFQRLSFLYQAVHCILRQNPENQELARFYCHTQKQHQPAAHVKTGSICKSCFSPLVPGVSSTLRQRKPHNQQCTIVRCLSCGFTKRFLSNPDNKLWSEQPKALLEKQTPPREGAKASGQTPSSVQQPPPPQVLLSRKGNTNCKFWTSQPSCL